ncbi:MAG TPA: DUF4386 family protein, partial [Aggregatilineaceae bacterium]|nr:DUF4386 family protein [Aggregatilineaceae bacterium]
MNNPNHLQKMGGAAGLIHGAAYLVSIIFFGVLISPYLNSDPNQYLAFVANNQVLMRAGILVAYWLTGGTVVVLALALHERLKVGAPASAQVAAAFALIWAALIIGSANLMINDFGVVAKLYAQSPAQAVPVWSALQAVENGIVSGNEIVGSLWVLLLSLAALRTGALSRGLNYLGAVVGAAGIFTSLLSFVIPETKDFIAIFGLGMIPWSIWVGIVLLRTNSSLVGRPSPVPA